MAKKSVADRIAKIESKMTNVELLQPIDMDFQAMREELIERLNDAQMRYRADGKFQPAEQFKYFESLVTCDAFASAWNLRDPWIANLMLINPQNAGRIVDLFNELIARSNSTELALANQSPLFEVEVVNADGLTIAEADRREHCAFAIKKALENVVVSCLEAGRYLKEIRDDKLFLPYETFEEYVKAEFDISRSRAQQLIDCAAIAENLSTIVEKLPSKEAHYRALAEYPEAVRAQLWSAVLDDREVTAPKIKAAATRLAIAPSKDRPPNSGGTRANNVIPDGSVELNHQVFTYAEAAERVDDPELKAGLLELATEHGQTEWNANLWETPDWLAKAIASLIQEDEVDILEPCAGTGQIVSAIREIDSVEFICAIEILPERLKALRHRNIKHSRTIEADFLTHKFTQNYDLVVTNPPFDIALDILERSLSLLHDGGRCLFVLPSAFFQSQGRGERFLGMDAHIHKAYPVIGRVAYLKDGVAVSGRQCEDAIFDIRNGKEGGCMEFINQ